jgi:hypothetical protein
MNENQKSPGFVLSHYTAMLIIGSIMLGASVIGIYYSGSIVIRDETGGNVSGPNLLPKSSVGPLTMYHVEFGFVFLSIVGFAALMWGYICRHEQSTLSGTKLAH